MIKANVRALAVGALILLLIGLIIWWVIQCNCIDTKYFNPSYIRDRIQAFGPWAVFVYIGVYVINTIFIFPPNAPISLAAGLIFGPLWGGVYIMISAFFATTAVFFIARSPERRFLDKLLQGRWKKASDRLTRHGFVTIMLLRIFPVVPYEILNYLSGLSRITYKDFILGTLIGMLPGAFMTSYLGGTLGSIDGLRDLLSPQVLTAFAVFAVFLIVGAIGFAFYRRHHKPIKKS